MHRVLGIENCSGKIESLLWFHSQMPPLFLGHSNKGVRVKSRHKFIPCVDSSTQNLLVHMPEICNFIDNILLPRQLLETSKENTVEIEK